MENLTQRWIKSGPVFQNKDTFFYFQKMAGEASSPRTPSPPTPLAAHLNFRQFV